jgi:superfamily II DNA or RNA helicase
MRGRTRGLAILASGLGKTFLAAFDVQAFEREVGTRVRVLYLSHQHIILEQAKRTFERVFGVRRSYGFLDQDNKDLDADFLFATFQSTIGILESLSPTKYDYVVVDEAHHTAAPTREKVVEHVSPRFLLGLTATPNRGDGKDVFDYYHDNVAVFLPLERAIVEDLLTPIEYRIILDPAEPIALSNFLRRKNYPINVHSLFRPRLDSEIVATVLEESSRVFNNPRVIVFCASLTQMDHFAKLFPDSKVISGRNTRAEQVSVLDAFSRGSFSVLLARDILNEGVDVPDANTLVFLRNTESPVVFQQQLGRGLRKSETKDRMLVLDFVNNLDRFQYVYSLFSRLEVEQIANDGRAPTKAGFKSELILDQVARDVIEVLIRRKEERNIIVELSSIVGALDYKVNILTLRKIVRRGLLIPDFVYEDARRIKRYFFEGPTLRRFLRLVHSTSVLEPFIHERAIAQKLGITVGQLHKREKHGNVQPSWIHIRPNGTKEFFFTHDDLAEFEIRST